jgi:hypothetical protein
MTTKHPDERIGGYVASFIAFSAITALWAFIVRSDDFYQSTELFGVEMPVITLAYLFTMPLIGFLAGVWRYHREGGFWLGKAVARSFQFVYAHLLIVLFTVAMVTDYFLGFNIDNAIRDIDDGLFDAASRFAPWLSAYLAGFNLGRIFGLRSWRRRNGAIVEASAPQASIFSARDSEAGTVGEERTEPVFSDAVDIEINETQVAPAGHEHEKDFKNDPSFTERRTSFTRLR